MSKQDVVFKEGDIIEVDDTVRWDDGFRGEGGILPSESLEVRIVGKYVICVTPSPCPSDGYFVFIRSITAVCRGLISHRRKIGEAWETLWPEPSIVEKVEEVVEDLMCADLGPDGVARGICKHFNITRKDTDA